jgi:hypothetical protein
MRVHLPTLYAGPLGCFGPGVCDVPDVIARDLIETGMARPLAEFRTQPAPAPAPAPRPRNGGKMKPPDSAAPDLVASHD